MLVQMVALVHAVKYTYIGKTKKLIMLKTTMVPGKNMQKGSSEGNIFNTINYIEFNVVQ
jgi:hypothetical protein